MALVDADSSRLLHERVGVLNIQRQSLEANRTQLFERRERWRAHQDCLDRLAEATVTVASSAGVLSYSESRSAIEIFGLQAIVWGTEPHYEIRTVLACLQPVV